MLTTVQVPPQYEAIFQKAEEAVARLFGEKREDPTKGAIEIFGERYILVRAASMSVDFFETVAALYDQEGKEAANNIARQLLFDIAHAIGKQDARIFHQKMNLHDPIEKLTTGPVHFAHAGWAFVDILPESTPSPDENCYMIYDHRYSFEAAAWLAAGKTSDFPVCIMNAGYSSGWGEESLGLGLVTTEIMCQAKGDPTCRFIMAPPARMDEHIAAYLKKEPQLAKKISHYAVPGFFKQKEIEAALRESEQRFRTIFDQAYDGMLLADAENQQFLMGNEAISRMLGYSQEELGQRGVRDIHPSEEGPAVLKSFEQQVKGEIELLADRAIRRKDGSTFYADIRTNLIKIGGHSYLLGVFRDISERKRAEEETTFKNLILATQLECSIDGILMVDENADIISYNRRFVEMWDIPPELVAAGIDEPVLQLVATRPVDQEGFLAQVRYLYQHRDETSREEIPLKDGRIIDRYSAPMTAEGGKYYGRVWYFRDITSRKRDEAELFRLNAELEQKVELLLELQQELVRKEQLAILGQLSGGVAHELRNPLGVMSNAVYFLKMVLPDTDETTREYLEIINQEIDNALRIITDLLDFARSKPPQTMPQSVRQLLDESLGKCVIPANVAVHVELADGLPCLMIDPQQMGQVLENLIINAIQEMPEGGVLHIAARRLEAIHEASRQDPQQECEDCIEISITDTGNGIAPEHLAQLFQPLFTTKPRGIGLGLAIAKKLSEANGGRIEVASGSGKGTTFRLLLKIGA